MSSKGTGSPFERPSSGGDVNQNSPTIPSGGAEPELSLGPEALEELASFGPYKVLRRLGEGGFGVVYACEQREPIRRQVALKVIKLGMDTREVIARFEAERQALALMDHPNVAKVLDAGVTPRGRPFFAMEFVAGMPITQYCDEARLGTRERLSLFMQVCHAVQHAHQKGIIHRDLKPSNVMVTLVDAKPVPKVIDFGIAKAAGQQLTARTMFTEAGRLIGTPAYMSPEQAGLSPLDVDTRTDVYALGVLLYELLTGVLPHEPEKLRSAALAEIQRIIREEEPPKPSTRLGQLGARTGTVSAGAPEMPAGTAEQIAQRRGMEPGQLVRELRGELDWITMKAMEKDRTRRYETAAAFAADVEHYLRFEPVTAGPPSATYRLRKFARRHQAGVITGVAFMVLVAGGVIGLSAAYGKAEEQRRIAEEEKQAAMTAMTKAKDEKARADGEMTKATAAFAFLSDMFSSIDPDKAKGREVTVRDVLDEAAKKIDQQKDATPDLEAHVREVLGTTYHKLAQYDQAEPQLRRALALREKEKGAGSKEALQDAHDLGAAQASRTKMEEADQLLTRAYEGRKALYGEKDRDTLASQSLLVYVKQNRGDMPGAEKMAREVIAAQTALLGKSDRDTLDSRCSLADILNQLGKLEEADTVSAELVDDSVKALGPDDPMTLQAMSIRGSILLDIGKFEEAEKLLRSVVELKTRVLGEGNSGVLVSMNALAITLEQNGKVDESEAMLRKIIEQATKNYGPEHQQTLSSMNNLAQLLRRAKKFDDAEKLYRETLALDRKVNGEGSEKALSGEVNLAMLLRDRGKHDEALMQLQHAHAGLVKAIGPDHWKVALTKGFMGDELVSLERYAEAETMLLEGYEGMSKALGAAHDRTRLVASYLAKLYEKTGKGEERAKWQERAKAAAK